MTDSAIDEVVRLRKALAAIATRIPPSESNEEAYWRWLIAYCTLRRLSVPARYAELLERAYPGPTEDFPR